MINAKGIDVQMMCRDEGGIETLDLLGRSQQIQCRPLRSMPEYSVELLA